MDEVIEKIREIRDALSTREVQDWTADQLHNAMTKLSIYRMNLGEFVADVEELYNVADDELSIQPSKIALQKIDEGMTATRAEMEGKVQSETLRQDRTIAKHRLTVVRNLYDDTEKMITVLQSRLKYLISDKRDI